jgi:hypothetical protein
VTVCKSQSNFFKEVWAAFANINPFLKYTHPDSNTAFQFDALKSGPQLERINFFEVGRSHGP